MSNGFVMRMIGGDAYGYSVCNCVLARCGCIAVFAADTWVCVISVVDVARHVGRVVCVAVRFWRLADVGRVVVYETEVVIS